MPRARAHPDGLPGSDRQPQPALHRVSTRSPTAAPAGRAPGSRAALAAGSTRSPSWSGLPRSCSAASRTSSRAGRSARRHRARDRARAAAARPRRADRGARRLGAGRHPEAARRPAPAARHELSVRLARPQRGAPAVRPRARDVSRHASSRSGPVTDVFERPRHPYTRALLSAVPERGCPARAGRASGSRASRRAPSIPTPTTCRFYGRCPEGHDRCAQEMPMLHPVGRDHVAACHLS